MLILNHLRIIIFLKYLQTPTDTPKVMATFWIHDFFGELAVLKSISTQKNKRLPWWKPTLRFEFLSLLSDMVIFCWFSLQISWMTATFSLFIHFYLFIIFGCCGAFPWLWWAGVYSLAVVCELSTEVAYPVGELRLGVWALVTAAARL